MLISYSSLAIAYYTCASGPHSTGQSSKGDDSYNQQKMNSVTMADFVLAAVRECSKMFAYDFDEAYSAADPRAAFKLRNNLNCCPCAASQRNCCPCASSQQSSSPLRSSQLGDKLNYSHNLQGLRDHHPQGP